ncbi:MAG TPA: hypothetical protein VIJ70_05375 [Gaiellaceae bacterium]|jgi:hypothetical protein
MAKKKKQTKAEREAWERHLDETVRNLRELAAGRAEREWRAKHQLEQSG